ncbi:thiamine pyrophosphate-binding protein [Nisaea sp.]|uniref:thiamine pyrophosphate-binding protein n=1 Tax=Nisaea sp. TaxID=2024842 RepID=UPI0032EFE11D
MKLSDYVVDFLARRGVDKAFAITGGASIHLIHSLGEHPDAGYICMHHEQACGMAADAYARVSKAGIGVAIATSGPGATNLITAIGCSWFDSIPVLYITGQVTRFRFKGDTGVRQIGFQETDIVPMVQPIVKYAAQVTDPAMIRFELEKALHIAKEGRPGPVLIDLPDDVQRLDIDPASLQGFSTPEHARASELDDSIDRILDLLAHAERPVLVTGAGIRLSGGELEIRTLQELLQIPVAPSWATMDMWPSDSPFTIGGFGTHGTRAGNFAVQNADFILAVGARLSTRETGSPLSSWAREARVAIVDIDAAELAKFERFGKSVDVACKADARDFLQAMIGRVESKNDLPAWPDWVQRIADWKSRYPVVSEDQLSEQPINPYAFFSQINDILADDEIIFVDTGCSLAWLMQAFRFNGRQRAIHDFNNTAMGYALPAAIGGWLAGDGRPVTCIVGDGSMMMNVQELATVASYKIPLKIIIINNNGYSMVQQTQEQWLDSKYYATSSEGGLQFPDFVALARSFGLPAIKVDANDSCIKRIEDQFASNEAAVIDVHIDRWHRVIPQSRFGRPIEDSEPLLERSEFLENMIVKPLDVSLEGK